MSQELNCLSHTQVQNDAHTILKRYGAEHPLKAIFEKKINAYQNGWFRSFSRRRLCKQLSCNLLQGEQLGCDKSTSHYMKIMRILSEEKKAALEKDKERHHSYLGRFWLFACHRLGRSDYLEMINQMQNDCLDYWLEDLKSSDQSTTLVAYSNFLEEEAQKALQFVQSELNAEATQASSACQNNIETLQSILTSFEQEKNANSFPENLSITDGGVKNFSARKKLFFSEAMQPICLSVSLKKEEAAQLNQTSKS